MRPPACAVFPYCSFVPRRLFAVITAIHVSTEHNQQLNEQRVISLLTTIHNTIHNMFNIPALICPAAELKVNKGLQYKNNKNNIKDNNRQ